MKSSFTRGSRRTAVALTTALGLAALTCVSGMLARPAHAAFAVFPRTGKSPDVAQRQIQRLFVSFEVGIETLVVEPSFVGSAADFGLVIPTPSLPDLSGTVDGAAFDQLASLTGLQYASGVDAELGPQIPAGLRGVNVVEKTLFGQYEATTLEARSADELIAWLDAIEYAWDPGYRPVLDDYISRGWFFVALKANLDEVSSTEPYAGPMPPVTLRFAVDEPVIPMRIAYAVGESYIDWTVFTDTAGELLLPTGATDSRTRRLSDEDLTDSPMLRGLVKAGNVLTGFRLGLATGQVSGDVVLNVRVDPGPEPDAGGCSVAAGRTPASASAGLALVLLAALGLLSFLRARSRARGTT
jgi:hypothetical protein